ncbi:amidohydrolase family protein [Acidiphilium sp. JA12-A1]|uniref:metal-dependent hydrolase family protein n=1 Tax=Acidiphilium sp. JA12-A1 TaxID=1464546 RepID=UPI00046186D3|nr:amidohydrolase family protein [Acidiphilium sp. JA12-A1]KDM65369.1 imidazolonepropionase [Acidiphilium sp. JA12-A1]
MSSILFENAAILDVEQGALLPDRWVLVDGARIASVSDTKPDAPGAQRIDLKGQTLMPGLIDCHVHVTAFTANFAELVRTPPSYVAAKSAEILGGMLRRGFTTVRDVGGADHGLARAIEEGLFPAPRLFFCGKALSPTGGHGDIRAPGTDVHEAAYTQPGLGRIADGVAAVRQAARDEIRRGAHHIKIMGGGGISSPTDRISSDQYSEEEIAAVVEEAAMANLYVAVHSYAARSIERCVRLGVRSIEHGNLATQQTIDLMKAHDAVLVPTLSVFRALVEEGVEAGLPKDLVGKTYEVLDAGINAVEMAYRAGVPMAYGTDLLGVMHRRQLDEFVLRADVVKAPDLIRAATINCARLIRREHELGLVKPGYLADLIVVDGNPLENIRIMADPQRSPRLVVKGGELV